VCIGLKNGKTAKAQLRAVEPNIDR
jgi:hypothetical protein